MKIRTTGTSKQHNQFKSLLKELEIYNEHDNEIKFTLYASNKEEAELFIRYFNNNIANDDEIRIV